MFLACVAATFQGLAETWHPAGGGHKCSNVAKEFAQPVQGDTRKLLKAAPPNTDDRLGGMLPSSGRPAGSAQHHDGRDWKSQPAGKPIHRIAAWLWLPQVWHRVDSS